MIKALAPAVEEHCVRRSAECTSFARVEAARSRSVREVAWCERELSSSRLQASAVDGRANMDGTVLITGSFHTVGDALVELGEKTL